MSWRHRNQPVSASGADENTGPIVEALRKVGCSVVVLTAVGGGVPDLLVGRSGQTVLLEVKRQAVKGKVFPSKVKLRRAQELFFAGWRGRPPVVVHTPEEALRAVGLEVGR